MHHAIVRVPLATLILAAGALAAPAAASSLFHGPSAALAQPFEYVPPFEDAMLGGPPAQTGHVIVTEFMKDPNAVTDTRGEWIEVHNRLPWRVNLEGWRLSDDSGAMHVISNGGNGVRMGPGGYLVLGNSSDTALNGGVQVDYQWSSFSLGNGADQIVLSRPDGTLVDRVAYDDGVLWPDTAGRSISLKLAARDALLNDDPTNWCHASSPISGTNPDLGTPRLDNDACP